MIFVFWLIAQASQPSESAASSIEAEPASMAVEQPASAPVVAEAPVTPVEDEPTFTLLGGVGRVSGEVLSRYANDTRFEATSEDVFEWRNRAQLKLDYRVAGKFRAFIGTRFDLYVKGAAPFRDTFWLANARNVRADGFVELREAYVDFYTKWVDIRIGNQIFAWGQNELFAPADMLNPIDVRDVLSSDMFKRPVPAVLATFGFTDKASLRLVWEPLFINNEIPTFGSDFALLVPGRALEQRLANVSRLVDPSIEGRVQSALQGSKIPNASPLNSTFGARLQYQLGTVDIAISGIFGWNRLAATRLDGDLATVLGASPGDLQSNPDVRAAAQRVAQKTAFGYSLVDSHYQRTGVVAIDAATTVSDFTFKLDVGVQPDTTLYLDGFQPTLKPMLRWVVGAEYNSGEDLSIWVSFFSNHVFGLDAGERLMFIEPAFQPATKARSAWWAGVLAIARYKLLDDRLELKLGMLYNITLSDAVLTGGATWNFNDTHHVTAGGMAIFGDAGTLVGQLSANNQLYVQYQLRF